MYYVYILENNLNKNWYIGYTSDLRRRLIEHNSGKSWKLIYYESYLDKQDATGREIFLKSGSGHKYINKQLFHYLKR